MESSQVAKNKKPKRLLPKRKSPEKSAHTESLKERLTKDGALEKAIERSYKRRFQRRGSPTRSGIYYPRIDLNYRDFLYDAIWEITRDAIAFEEERALKLTEHITDPIDEDTIRHKARKLIIREMGKQLGLAQSKLKYSYPAELSAKTDWTAPQWLRDATIGRGKDKISIWKRMERYHFEEIYSYLIEHKLSTDAEDRELTRKMGWKAWKDDYPDKPGDRMDGIIIPDYEHMSEYLKKRHDLELSPQSLYLHLKAYARHLGIIERKGGRKGEGRIITYKIGEWRGWKNPETGQSGKTFTPLLAKPTRKEGQTDEEWKQTREEFKELLQRFATFKLR
jgi:hypothetical protein